VRCASAGAKRREGGLCAGPANVLAWLGQGGMPPEFQLKLDGPSCCPSSCRSWCGGCRAARKRSVVVD
jgi:hypothetical protein